MDKNIKRFLELDKQLTAMTYLQTCIKIVKRGDSWPFLDKEMDDYTVGDLVGHKFIDIQINGEEYQIIEYTRISKYHKYPDELYNNLITEYYNISPFIDGPPQEFKHMVGEIYNIKEHIVYQYAQILESMLQRNKRNFIIHGDDLTKVECNFNNFTGSSQLHGLVSIT